MQTRRIVLAIALSSLCLAAAVAESARLECTAGFGSHAVPRRWIPVFIRSDKALDDGRIELRRLDREGKTMSLETYPYRESVRIECPLLMDEECVAVLASLKAGGHTLAESRLELWEKIFPGHIILQSGMPSAVQRSLSSLLMPIEPIQAVSLRPQDLPGLALDYDSVSAVMMSDPGDSLSPAQVEAMRAWIASGGRLVLTGLHPAGGSLVAALGAPYLPDGTLAFGMGRIAAFTPEASELPRMDLDSRLRDAIALKPYGAEAKLSASAAFAARAPAARPEEGSGPGSGLSIALILWAGALSASYFVPKRRLLYVLGVSLLFSAAAVPASLAIDRAWRRGGSAALRLVGLPESSGFLAEAEFALNGTDTRSTPLGMSAWSLGLGFDVSERGSIGVKRVASWEHRSWKPRFMVVSGSKGGIRLSGYLPQLIADAPGLAALREELRLSGGAPLPLKHARQGALAYYSAQTGLWYLWDHLGWRWNGLGYCPPEFQKQEAWIRQLAALPGMRGSFVGVDSFPALRFAMEGSPETKAAWALPQAAEGP